MRLAYKFGESYNYSWSEMLLNYGGEIYVDADPKRTQNITSGSGVRTAYFRP